MIAFSDLPYGALFEFETAPREDGLRGPARKIGTRLYLLDQTIYTVPALTVRVRPL